MNLTVISPPASSCDGGLSDCVGMCRGSVMQELVGSTVSDGQRHCCRGRPGSGSPT